MQKECKFCGAVFKPSNGKQKFCSPPCRINFNNASRVKTKKVKADKLSELAQVNAKAREMGLHYGEYVARYL